MVGKNNKFLKENKNNQRFLRFSLRKLSVGVVSVAIAAGFYVGGSQSVLADTTSTIDPVVNQQSASTSTDSPAVASTADSTAAEAGKSAAPAASSAAEAGKSAAPAASSAAEQQKMAMFTVAKAKSAATSNTDNPLGKKVQSNAASDTAKAEEDQLADKLLKNIKISDPTDSNFARYQGYVDKYNNQTTDTSSQYVFSVIRDYYGYDFIWTIDRDTGSKVFVYLAAKYGRGDEEIKGYALPSDGGNFDSKDGNIILNYTPKTDSGSGSINVAAQDGRNHLTAVYGLGTPAKSSYRSIAELLPEKGQPIIKFLYKDPNSDGKLVNLRKPIYCKEGLTGQSFVLDTSNYANDISDYTKNDKAFDGFTLEPNKNNDDNKIFEGTFTQFDQGKTYVKYYRRDDSEVIYQQLDASGTMKVDYYKDVHSYRGPRFVGSIDRLETGKSQEIIDDATDVTIVRNPFVSGSHSYEFIYNPDPQTGKIVYQDADNNNIEVDHTDLNGKTTQHVTVNPQIPDGYEIIPGQSIPKTRTATSNGIPDVIVNVRHHKITVTPGQEPNPGDKKPGNTNKKPGDGTPKTDVSYETLHRNMTRTINVTDPHTGLTTTTKVTLNYERIATIDDVTGDVTYGTWTVVDGSESGFDAFTIPDVPGYTSKIKTGTAEELEALTPNQDQITNWQDQIVDIDYTANEQTGKISYVDGNGNEVSHTDLAGKTGNTINVNPQAPIDWKIVPGQSIPKTVVAGSDGIPTVTVQVEHDTITVTPDQPKNPSDKLPDGKNYPSGVDQNDLNHDVVRTINITKPGKTTTTTTQKTSFNRTATIDLVDHSIKYGNWVQQGDNGWKKVDVPVVDGYTPSVQNIDKVAVTPDTKDATIDVTYTANDQSMNINYVDDQGNVITNFSVGGKTGQTVDTKAKIPAGWVLVKGQHDAPAMITFTGAHTDDITIKIEHGKTSVDHNHPVTPGDKTPSGKEINGAHKSDLNQTITRTINITEPGQATKTTTQVAHIYRDATVDDVTGEVTYSAWSTDSTDWTAVNVPSHVGYTAHQSDGQTGIPVVTVKDGQKDVNIDVTYTPDEQKDQITYVDEKGNQISSTPLTGKTDQDVDVKGKINVPANWELVPGQTIPDTVKATADGIPTVTVKVQPKMDSITDPAKLNKSISRTITINKPGEKPQVINQHADFTRTGQYNEVTGTTIYTDWALKDSTLEAVDAPAVPGYTPNVAHVDSVKNPTADTKLNDVVINYTADDQNQVVNYVDQNGKVIKSDTITGKTDQTVDVNVKVPDHYELVNGQNIPENVTLKTNNPVINIQVTPKMDDITAPSQLTKAISRTITINVPHQTPIVENQSANFTRTGQHNEVTGEDVYTGWTLKGNTLEAVDAPAVPGYTPNVTHVDGVKNPTADTKLNDVVINYTADDQTGQITYVDEKGNQISSTPLTGKTDEDIAINPVAPAGWELVPGQKYPVTVTATADGIPGVTLTVRHHMINVIPGDVPTSGDKKPGNNDKKPGDGTPNKDITHEGLNKTITRTFIVKAPTGTMTKTQHISYQRTATIDDVTGDVTFSDWNTDGASFKAEVIPAISGYTSHVTEGNYGAYAPSQDQINNWTDPMITVTYTANDQSQVINYVDDHNKTIKTDTVHGKTDETVNVTPSVPDHYELVPGQNIPSEVTLKDKNTPIIVKVQPKVDSITDPAKLNKSISRTITINKPGEKPQVINQHADFTRTGQYNEVTGTTIYTNWVLKDSTLEAVDASAVPGYTPNVAHVDGVENPTADTKLANVVINYSADDQTQKIDYVDPNGKVVKTDTVKGKTDETVKVTPNVPDHYELVSGQNIPSEVTLKDKNTPIIVKVQPKVDSITDPAKLNKSISRTITINKPGEKPQVINQTATFKRTGKTNEVTGITTYTPWVLDQNGLTTVSAPEVPGYTPSQKTVASVDNPTANTKLTDVTINYTANSQTTHINYVDKDGETVKSDTVSGKTDETVKTNSEVPAGWKIIDGQVPEMIHFTGEGTPDTTITIEHDTTSVDHTKPIKPGDKTPSGKEIKGAHESDLNQTITRTINVTTPDGQTTTTKQVAKIYRDATIDDVTGEVTYGDWSEGTWVDFKPGQVAGYTASPADVPAVTVKDGQKDQTVDITYTANEGTVLIKYVDRDGNEIGQQVITGHVGDTIKVTPQFPENWVPVDPDTVPAEVQIKEENGQIIIVVVRHAEKDPVQTKKVTRTITVTTPDGQTKTIKQVVTISRHGDLDLVTGQIAWQPWTTAQWDVFKPAAIAGYTPSLAEVPAVTVDGETTDQTVDITYAAVATPAQPEHQAPTASDTTDAQQATNQKADSNAQPAVTVVTSQQTATAQQAESTTNSRRLPQTGNSHDASALAGLGLASLMGLFGLGGKRRKRD